MLKHRTIGRFAFGPGSSRFKAVAVAVCNGGGFLQGGVCGDHFSGNQVLPDAEMFKRTLGLSAP